MELPELDRKCPECNGAGVIQAPEWADWWERYQEEIVEKAGSPRLDPENVRAIMGPEPTVPEEVLCGVCHGLQRVPTEEGQRILDFIGCHYGLG